MFEMERDGALVAAVSPCEAAFRGGYLLEVTPESGDVGDRQLALPSLPNPCG
jgi:hypothetical protein